MKLRVGVIFGGVSVEHEVSIISAVQAMKQIDEEKYEVIPIYIGKDREWYTGKLLKNIEDEVVFSNDGDTIWICRNCGHIVVGKKAPEVCPVCKHKQSFFERKANNY